MLSKFIDAYGDIERLQTLANAAKKGRKGLDLGCPATVLDAAKIIKQCWDAINPSAVVNCWRQSKCLPHLPESTSHHPNSSAILKEAVQDLSLAVCSAPAETGLPDIIDNNLADFLNRWLHLEQDPDILTSDDLLLAEEVEASLIEEDRQNSLDCTDMMEVDNQEEKDVRQNLLYYANEAILLNIRDPVLLDIAKKLQSHLSKN